ncbi:hypothetical protein CYMTET_14242 [Cymbomonas tetramitiformis]|uniref:Uncharacterized protein n=1 Tax=Cymbomonas tetramitiformis TaxID=36881 RepID=A0AAE0LA81_9CHLO|nr:hypothetical protein CYMTET_14242 [Cymbomonas tetramitiformis]
MTICRYSSAEDKVGSLCVGHVWEEDNKYCELPRDPQAPYMRPWPAGGAVCIGSPNVLCSAPFDPPFAPPLLSKSSGPNTSPLASNNATPAASVPDTKDLTDSAVADTRPPAGGDVTAPTATEHSDPRRESAPEAATPLASASEPLQEPSITGVPAEPAALDPSSGSLLSDAPNQGAVDVSLETSSGTTVVTPSSTSEPQACSAEDALKYSTSAENCAFNFRVNCSATKVALQDGNEEGKKIWRDNGAVEFCDTDLAHQFARQQGCIFVEDGEFQFRSECESMALPKFSCAGGKPCTYTGEWKSWDIWRPAEPSYHVFSKSEAFRLVAKRRVAFLGDSLCRQTFNHFVQFLRGNSQYADVPQMDHLFYKITSATAKNEGGGVSNFIDSFIMRSKSRHHFEVPMTKTEDAYFEFMFLFVHHWKDIPDYFNASNTATDMQLLKQFDPDVVVLHTGAWVVAKEGCPDACPVEQQRSFEIIKEYYTVHQNTTMFYLLGAPDQRKDQSNIMEMNEFSRAFCESNSKWAKYIDFYGMTHQSPGYVWSKNLEDDLHFGCGFVDSFHWHIAKGWRKSLGKLGCEDVVNHNIMQVLLNHWSQVFND